MNVLKLQENKKAPNNRCRPLLSYKALKAKKPFLSISPFRFISHLKCRTPVLVRDLITLFFLKDYGWFGFLSFPLPRTLEQTNFSGQNLIMGQNSQRVLNNTGKKEIPGEVLTLTGRLENFRWHRRTTAVVQTNPLVDCHQSRDKQLPQENTCVRDMYLCQAPSASGYFWFGGFLWPNV